MVLLDNIQGWLNGLGTALIKRLIGVQVPYPGPTNKESIMNNKEKIKKKLLSKVYGYLKATNIKFPLKVAVALSGGSDSMALALLLAKYGQCLHNGNIEFIHINHMWRNEESEKDAFFVKNFADKLGVKISIYNCPNVDKTMSKEYEASINRKKIFERYVSDGYIIFTGHNANDVLETMLWRLCDGKLDTHDKGILVKTEDGQFRPFLTTNKTYLQEFLKLENQDWKEDYTNFEAKLMRSKLRMNVVPELLKIYPKALEKVSIQAVNKQFKKEQNYENNIF